MMDEDTTNITVAKDEERRGHRRDDLSGLQIVAGLRNDIEHARLSIQIPFAWLIEPFEDVLDDIAGPVLAEIVGEHLARLVLERDEVLVHGDRSNGNQRSRAGAREDRNQPSVEAPSTAGGRRRFPGGC